MTNTTHKSMPSSGREGQEILSQLDAFKAEDPEYKNEIGRASCRERV